MEALGEVPEAQHYKRLYEVLPCCAKAECADAARLTDGDTPLTAVM